VNDPELIECVATPVLVHTCIAPADHDTELYADDEKKTEFAKSVISPPPVVSIQFFPFHVLNDVPCLQILCVVGDRGSLS
jgi:hypothetical protein